MKYIKLFSLMALSSSAWAQTEKTLPDFNEIDLDVPVKIVLVSGTQNKVSHSKGFDGIKFNVVNKVLSVESTGEAALGAEPIELFFTHLKKVEMNGAGNLEMKDGSKVTEESFELECNGASKAKLNLTVGTAKIECTGASKITLKGEAEKVNFEISGASKLYASDFKCKTVDLDASGATYFNVNATKELVIDASGFTKGVYTGNPEDRTVNISGSANIVDANTGDNMKDDRVSGDDTTRITVGKKKFIIIEEGDDVRIEKFEEDKPSNEVKKYNLKKVYAGFELGMNQFVSPNLKFDLPAGYEFLNCQIENSWFFGLNLLEGDLQLIKNKLAITSGLGMEFQNMHFQSDRILLAHTNTIMADSGLIPLTKNKLYAYTLNAPLLIKFAPRTRKDRNNFHLAVGVIGSFKAYSHVRNETTHLGYEQELKNKDDFNMNPFRLTATARIGYGWFRAFANYSLTPYFNRDYNDPDIRVFSAGITLIPFQE